MSVITVKLKDGLEREVVAGTTIYSLAGDVSERLQDRAVGAKVNGALVDLAVVAQPNDEIDIVSQDDSAALYFIRHTAAHVLAQALRRVFGEINVQLGVGPVTEDGFYYDVDVPRALDMSDLERVEQMMAEIARENLSMVREEVSRAEAIQIFRTLGDEYKLELIANLAEDAVITVYRQGEFVDLCRGPHAPSTRFARHSKLLSVGGAYWRGDAKNKMLQRIYGTAFARRSQLDDHLQMLAEAKKRDHRKLGKELGLFFFSEETPGMPFYLPGGLIVRTQLEDHERKLQAERGYQEVRTPLMMNERLWRKSGHLDHYQENMYFVPTTDEPFALKPMNCPGHMLIYKSQLRSYRDLPIRLAENGLVHRNELSGALNGMLRVRAFTQDDAHIFVREGQIASEMTEIIHLIDDIYQVFGFEYEVELSTRPVNSMGSGELWSQAESALAGVLSNLGLRYRVNHGDGAFYGPKIDFHIRDELKRRWQCATIQLDFQLPENFDLTYVGEDNQKHRPVVIHRAIMGSVDRFLGILTEHYAGAFPLWLAPTQVRIIPVSDTFLPFARVVEKALKASGIRVDVDDKSEKMGHKVRDAQVKKIPFAVVVGAAEAESQKLSIRRHGQAGLVQASIQEFLATLLNDIAKKQA